MECFLLNNGIQTFQANQADVLNYTPDIRSLQHPLLELRR